MNAGPVPCNSPIPGTGQIGTRILGVSYRLHELATLRLSVCLMLLSAYAVEEIVHR
ncbi:hypothetical protein SBA5_400035 [Candidatus Sulfotelmatomonas gaucii]|uniref:Uncharacterized protein n=1 Tax=Candidatus Sulfuritelmatomonas gaucii TaxID=2043161 RepID=A0A2N9LKF3_9BACT|nr:hypothetical protein SBA5_400035 [Candidatus Sulfotelmatomonas gaucii]